METIKKKSKKQEKGLAHNFSGKITPASGALWGAKGDVRNEDFLIECKVTEKPSYSITKKTWDKIADEALHDGMRTPLMNIHLEDGKLNLIVISFDDFLELSQKATKYDIIKKI